MMPVHLLNQQDSNLNTLLLFVYWWIFFYLWWNNFWTQLWNFSQSAKDFLHTVQLCFPIMLMGVQLVSSYKIYDMISCFLRSMYLITRTTSFLLSELFFSPPGYDHLLLHVLLLNDNGQDNFVHVRTILKLPCFIFIILIYGQLIK